MDVANFIYPSNIRESGTVVCSLNNENSMGYEEAGGAVIEINFARGPLGLSQVILFIRGLLSFFGRLVPNIVK